MFAPLLLLRTLFAVLDPLILLYRSYLDVFTSDASLHREDPQVF